MADSSDSGAYDFWYWPSIPGRGEFVRLTLEACGIPYRDRAREDGAEAMMKDMAGHVEGPAYAPPYIGIDGQTVSQTANILMFLSERHDCGPTTMKTRYWLNQVQLTIMDVVAEAHNVHHPVAAMLYYEDQKAEAARAAEQFRKERIPGYFAWFEKALKAAAGDWLTGSRWSYADLSLFQLVSGLRYAFPKRIKSIEGDYPRLMKLCDLVAAMPELKDYFRSNRRIAFNNDGIFRHYPELDAA
ncbi:glutathione S-transferase [Sphingobium phenoxybenzoativorans]|uniref:Glutathione S-transferase n=1 Tax=Sphingobium phenoxybenzoativorans TaxID=1592790 RepID=A0A975Q0H7_9SPHN|nr:glutathione S-transferase [Sphingobium phenoxybenzoativorans]QUT04749.1 glutathione S-transferase [Sphingobium phenoxybenzoativorans]